MPFTVMLGGITSDSVRQWLGGASSSGGLSGFAASPAFGTRTIKTGQRVRVDGNAGTVTIVD